MKSERNGVSPAATTAVSKGEIARTGVVFTNSNLAPFLRAARDRGSSGSTSFNISTAPEGKAAPFLR